MKTIKSNEWIEVLNNQGAVGNLVLSDESKEIVHLSLTKSAIIPLHALPVDVTFFILEGTPIFVYEEKEERFEANDTVFCPANKQRSWKNLSETTSKILVIKSKVEK